MASKIERVYKLLDKQYELNEWHSKQKPIDMLVGTILSQNTTDKNSASAFASLRKKYKTWQKVLDAPLDEVAETIRHGGLPRIKANRIQAALREIRSRTGKLNLDVIKTMNTKEAADFLTSLHGVGPKTAAVVLSFAFNKPTIPVDTHVHRLANRIGIASAKTPAKTQEILEREVPDKLKNRLHILLITHGRETCKAQNPRCEDCVLRDMCFFP
jgi:endonuclease-3